MFYVVVEGHTEQTFIRDILAPYLYPKNIYLKASLIGKPGHKGGNVKFDRAQSDIVMFLKQRSDIYVSTMFDYFRLDTDWPGQRITKKNSSALDNSEILERKTLREIEKYYPDFNSDRFIPYFSMHEFEALLFSDSGVIAEKLSVKEKLILDIIEECKEPEEINDEPETAPSKRIEKISGIKYKKTITGIAIAKDIGIVEMRKKCPVFNLWLKKLEKL